jgi:ERCC4-type nuclease
VDCKGEGIVEGMIQSPKGKLFCKSCRCTGKSLYTLSSGDVCFGGKGPNESDILIGIEVCTIEDLLSKLQSKRLQDQLKRMAVDYTIRRLLVYGRYRPGPNDSILIWEEKKERVDKNGKPYFIPARWMESYSGYKYSMLSRFLVSPSFTNLFIYDHVESQSDAARWIYETYKEWNKPWKSHRSMRSGTNAEKRNKREDVSNISSISSSTGRHDKNTSILGISLSLPDKRIEQNISFACSLPGIKFDRANAIAQHFYSIEEMVKADVKEWSEIAIVSSGGRRVRLGEKNAQRIWNAIHWPGKGTVKGVRD